MRSTLATALLLTLAFAVLRGQGPVFRAGTEMVVAEVLVTANGQPVTDLMATDLALTDNGEMQRLEFVRAEDAPLDVVFVCDTSGSISEDTAAMLRNAVSAAFASMRPEDHVALIRFDTRISRPVSLYIGVDDTKNVVAAQTTQRGTALRDAVFSALAWSTPSSARRLIVLLTDGIDTASWLTTAQVLQAAKRSNATLYAVAPNVPADGFLTSLATETGGRVLSSPAMKTVDAKVREVFSDMRHRYVLGFMPTTKVDGWHKLEVQVHRRGVDVRARPGYYREQPPSKNAPGR